MDDYEWSPCMNCMMGMQQQPMMENNMMNMPMMDMEEEEMKMMYPSVHGMLMPMIKKHCDEYEEKHGTMHCPKYEDIEEMCEKIYKKIQEDLDEKCGEDKDDDEDYSRIRRYGRRRAVNDLIKILLLNELRGRRRRRRRRPRPHYWGY